MFEGTSFGSPDAPPPLPRPRSAAEIAADLERLEAAEVAQKPAGLHLVASAPGRDEQMRADLRRVMGESFDAVPGVVNLQTNVESALVRMYGGSLETIASTLSGDEQGIQRVVDALLARGVKATPKELEAVVRSAIDRSAERKAA